MIVASNIITLVRVNDGAKGATGAPGPKGDGLDIKDTRNDNQPPSWYFTNYPKTTVAEIKTCSKIGLSGVGTYCTVVTTVPWTDSSGGYPKQTAKVESTGKEYWRVGKSTTAWSSWVDPYGKALDAGKTATNYIKGDGNGLIVGNMASSTLGKNVKIDTDSVDIRNGSDMLASFGAKRVILGQNAADSEILLCNGAGRIKATTSGASTSYPAYDSILIDSQEIEMESLRFTPRTSNTFDAATTPAYKNNTEVYMLSDKTSPGAWARLKSECVTTSSGDIYHTGVSTGAYNTDSTSVMLYAEFFDKSANTWAKSNHFTIYPTKTTTTKPITINGISISGKNKVLWTGSYYMSDTQTATLSEAISKQPNGIVLVWSYYLSGAADNSNFQIEYIPKQFVASFPGKGISKFMTNGTMSVAASKYVYISDTTLKGHANNDDAAGAKNSGITSTPKNWVLRQVIGV